MGLLGDARRLLSGGALLATGNAGVALLATKWLSPGERGVMVVAATISVVVSLLATLGVGNALKATRPSAPTGQRRSLNESYATMVVSTALVGGAVSTLAALAVAPFVSDGLATVHMLLAVAMGGASLVLSTQLADGWFSGGRFGVGARWAAATAIVGLGAVILFQPSTGAGVLTAQFAGGIVTQGVQILFLGRAELLAAPRLHWELTKGLLKQAIPSLGLSAGSTVVLRADRLLLAFVVPPEVVASYALAATISEASRLIPTSLGQLALHRAARGTLPTEIAHVNRISRLTVLAVGLASVVASFLLVPRVFGDAYASAPTLVAIMLIGEIFFNTYLIASMALIGRGDGAAAGRIGLMVAPLSVVAYLAGAVFWGAIGCAVAGSVLYAGMARTARAALSRPGVRA